MTSCRCWFTVKLSELVRLHWRWLANTPCLGPVCLIHKRGVRAASCVGCGPQSERATSIRPLRVVVCSARRSARVVRGPRVSASSICSGWSALVATDVDRARHRVADPPARSREASQSHGTEHGVAERQQRKWPSCCRALQGRSDTYRASQRRRRLHGCAASDRDNRCGAALPDVQIQPDTQR